MKKIALFALVALLIFTLASCGDKTLEKDGFTITLPATFIDMTTLADGVVANYATVTGSMVVTVIKTPFSELSDDMTAYDFAELLVNGNGFDTEIQNTADCASFAYNYDVEGEEYTYLAFCYVGKDGYWFVTFACPSNDYEKNEAKMREYASTIIID